MARRFASWLVLPLTHAGLFGASWLLCQLLFVETHPLAVTGGYVVGSTIALAVLSGLVPAAAAIVGFVSRARISSLGPAACGALSGFVASLLFRVWPAEALGQSHFEAMLALNGVALLIVIATLFACDRIWGRAASSNKALERSRAG